MKARGLPLPMRFAFLDPEMKTGRFSKHAMFGLATFFYMGLPATALAHGFPSEVATFAMAFLVLLLIIPPLVDQFAFKRLPAAPHTKYAAALAHIAAAGVAVPVFLMLQRLSSAAASALEPSALDGARLLRTIDLPVALLLTMLAMALAKSLALNRFASLPFSPRTFGILLLSTFAGVAAAAAVAALIAWTTI